MPEEALWKGRVRPGMKEHTGCVLDAERTQGSLGCLWENLQAKLGWLLALAAAKAKWVRISHRIGHRVCPFVTHGSQSLSWGGHGNGRCLLICGL